jgi:filamentous hemagglutinin family protein
MKPSHSLFYIAQSSALLTLLAAYPTTAQIIPDNTVNTIVTPNGNINLIEGGTRAGTNLFHSFQEFSIPTGSEAFFNNAFDIRNIFSRVTGRSISNIDGLIRANGIANLFLLNPNGIIFGQNARLNIGGSFLATTANSFKFADGIEFSATNPQAAPLLSVNVPIGLQMGSNPGNITVNGTGLNRPLPVEGETLEQRVARGIAFEEEVLNNLQGLQVQPGKTIALVGGNLTFNGGLVTVRQGRIEIGSVNSGEVSLNPTETGLVLGYENISNFGEIQMSQSSAVAASGEGAGEVRVRGGKITLNEISSIGANTIGNENGKSVTVEAEQLSLFGGSFLVSGTFSSGDAGNLIVKATELIEVNGISADGLFSSSLQTFSNAGGKAGNLTIDTGRLTIRDGAFISTGTSSKGQGGNLNIQASQEVQVNGISADGKFRSALATQTNNAGNAGNMTIETGRLIVQNGAFVSTQTSGQGQGGNLTVRASEEVKVSGTSANGKAITLLSSGSNGSGNSGELRIETGKLIIQNGAEVSSFTSGEGKAGNLFVNAREEVQVNGTSADGRFPSALISLTNSAGNAGDMTIQTGRLVVRDGAFVSTETRGTGNGGNLLVQARDSVEVLGEGPIIFSRLSSGVSSSAVGNGGNLTIETRRLSLRDGGQVSANVYGQGKGGNIQVKANEVVEVVGAMSKGLPSTISTTMFKLGQGHSGDININTERLSLRDGGQISAAISGKGNAGNIQIKAGKSVEVVGTTSFGNASTITTQVAGSVVGKGGDINIDTQSLSLRNGGEVTTDNFGVGSSGNIYIRARDFVEVVGEGPATPDSPVGFTSRLSSSVLSDDVANGGNLTIETKRLSVRDGGQVSASLSSKGKGGSIQIKASELVEVVGVGKIREFEDSGVRLSSQIDTSIRRDGEGFGGDINIETQVLSLRDGGQISANTLGMGDAGTVGIQASKSVEIIGAVGFGNLSGITTRASDGVGQGGDINIDTQVLSLQNGGQISASTFSVGNSGNIYIRAKERVEVDGAIPNNQFTSSIDASTLSSEKGNGGNITIETKLLTIGNGSISTSTAGNGNAGEILLQASEAVELSQDNQISAVAVELSQDNLIEKATGNGGKITIETQRLRLADDSNVFVFTNSQGKGGTIVIRAFESVQISDDSSLSAFTSGTGDGGNIIIETGQLIIQDPGRKIFATSNAEGNGGNIKLQANQLIVRNGAQVSLSAFDAGKAGNLTVIAQEIEITGTSPDGQASSGLFTTTQGTGDGGNLTIETKQLTVQDGATITASTFDAGNAGNLTITADVVQLTADSKAFVALSTSTEGVGNAGTLTINTRNFIVQGGAQVVGGSFGSGKGGDLKIKAELVELAGKTIDGWSSGLFVNSEAAGNAGNLIINTERLIVRDGARVSGSSFGTGAAGNLEVTANSILIDNEGILRATTAAGSQGNINLQTSSLIMRRGSSITTNAEGKATGGNIIINTDVLAALENSDISANAEDSFGGRVFINAQAIFGTKFRPENTPQSDITATSELSPQFSGSVEINTPVVDPSSGLVNLPNNGIDVNQLIAQSCLARRKETGSFYITGNGGFQHRPGDGLISPLPTGEVRSIPENNSSERSEVNGRIIEAQGIYKLENGQMVLGWECPQ